MGGRPLPRVLLGRWGEGGPPVPGQQWEAPSGPWEQGALLTHTLASLGADSVPEFRS